MCIMMEKYHEPGNDYFIWDPIKNKMELDSKKVKAIYKSNLGTGADAIIYGPIKEENQLNFRIYNPDGTQRKLDEGKMQIILEYLRYVNYIDEIRVYEEKLNEFKEEGSLIPKKINNIGFVILANQFVEELQALV